VKQTRCPKCGLWKNRAPFNLEEACICGRKLPSTGNGVLAAILFIILAVGAYIEWTLSQ
jgi:hypothetical protein